MKKTLSVDGMSCNHCVQKIQRFVSECEGVKILNIDIDNKILEVDIDDEKRLPYVIEAVEDAGFIVK
ncbi:heavy-metal-associated domain-containing protein [Helicobacter sp. MIT 99-5507]|uniref:heavy-metal-associated domain-containing protein n=1 Tax=Helicobacter sp. MIT 99-5507 TaxID=152489 RepID=UPI000E1F68E7|nr:copper ion binding protein [Helicobacter sp. MIT 99-5507]RDU58178.1 copper resistance protein CopZ [Helicobacter sp. MIT 99-5507]